MKKLMILGLLALSACASNPHKAEKLDTKVEYQKEVSGNTVIGVKDGDMVVQRKVVMSEELRSLQLEVYSLEASVYGGHRYLDNRGLYGVLQDCYLKKAQVTGELIPMAEKREYVIPDDGYSGIGLDEKNMLIGVEEEYLKDRIARFRTYRKVLTDRETEYETKIKQCELQLTKN